MKAIDISIRVATVVVIVLGCFLANKKAMLLWSFLLFAVGLWSVLYPPGVLGWAKWAHPELNPFDERAWPICRFIGICFIVFAVMMITSAFAR